MTPARFARCTKAAWLLLVAGTTGIGQAGAAEPEGGERARISHERSAAEARFAARDKECRERFVVSACVEDARRDRRLALDALRARQLAVDEARRRERSAARQTELGAKAADDARREQERAARAGSGASAASGASSPREGRPLEPRRGGTPSPPRAKAAPHDRPRSAEPGSAKQGRLETTASRRAREAASRASFSTRQQQAARHRDEAIAATARRMQQHSPARSLPTPPVGAAPAPSSGPKP